MGFLFLYLGSGDAQQGSGFSALGPDTAKGIFAYCVKCQPEVVKIRCKSREPRQGKLGHSRIKLP